jgi:hypothetical protein
MKRKGWLVGILTAGLLLAAGIVRSEPDGLLSVENKYIKVYLNNSDEETGRFAVDVTGGDYERTDDDNKPLIYGRPRPWTSFTTLRIDGADYVFGKATHKRAGAGLPGGEVLQSPRSSNHQLTMKCQYGTIVVEQILDITRSPSTGALDTARIRYILTNQGTAPAELGLRVLLDTMVGDNDGAPFRLGDHEVTTDRSFAGKDCPDFWQAFDSMAKPAVIAQGTLKGGDVTTPDRIAFTNWGKAADNPWEIPLEEGADFTREGEDELDSALAMFWLPRTVKPGDAMQVVIDYGLGGITFSPGNTYLGISAPAEVAYSISDPRTYLIIMYLEHRGEAKAENVQIRLELPPGLVSTAGTTEVRLAELIPGVTKQFSWEVRPDGSFSGDASFAIQVTGDHLEANQVTRKIRIIGPPRVEGVLKIPAIRVEDNHWDPYPLPVTVTLRNRGEAATGGLKAVLTGDAGFRLADGERSEKFLGNLAPQEETTVTWQVVPNPGAPHGRLQAEVTGAGIRPERLQADAEIPPLPFELALSGAARPLPGQVYLVDVSAYNLSDATQFNLDIRYDPKQLRLVSVSRGTFLVEENGLSRWSGGAINGRNGTVTGISGSRSQPFSGSQVTLARLNFIVVGSGAGRIQTGAFQLRDAAGRELSGEPASLQYQIGEESQ